MSRFQAPGKLFLAGEYAVVDPAKPALLTAVRQSVSAHVHDLDSDDVRIQSAQWGPQPRAWERTHLAWAGSEPGMRREPAMRALDVLDAYLADTGAPTRVRGIQITLDSSMVGPRAVKYGFGSSGAVIVAVIGAVMRHLGRSVSADELFRLSALSVIADNQRASCADVAVSAFLAAEDAGTTWMMYRSFDRDAVAEIARRSGVLAAMNAPWPGLGIRTLAAPSSARVIVAHTGSAASSERLVERMDAVRGASEQAAFASDIERMVVRLEQALEADNAAEIMEQLDKVATRLAHFDGEGESQIGIVTPTIRQYIHAARQVGGVAKSSGAGGGDCVIALAHPHAVVALKRAWHTLGAHIVPVHAHEAQGPGTFTHEQEVSA